MSIATSELQVAEGLADDFDLRSLHYGILLHRRRAVGTAVVEEFEYRALVDANGNPLQLPGIAPDDERIEFERGHGSALDRRLVRRSAFSFAPSAATGQGVGSLQEVFLAVKPKKGSSFQPALGLKWVGGPNLKPKVCPPDGLPAIRIWCTEEWQDRHFADAVAYDGDLAAWVEALGRTATDALSDIASAFDDFGVAPGDADAPRIVRPSGQTLTPLAPSADASTRPKAVFVAKEAPVPAYPPMPNSMTTETPGVDARGSKRRWKVWVIALGAVGLTYFMFFQPPSGAQPPALDKRETVAKKPAPGPVQAPSNRTLPSPAVVVDLPAQAASVPSVSDSEIERLARSILVPVGNSPAERQRLYDPTAGFEQNLALLSALLDSAQKGEQTSFDQFSAVTDVAGREQCRAQEIQ